MAADSCARSPEGRSVISSNVPAPLNAHALTWRARYAGCPSSASVRSSNVRSIALSWQARWCSPPETGRAPRKSEAHLVHADRTRRPVRELAAVVIERLHLEIRAGAMARVDLGLEARPLDG